MKDTCRHYNGRDAVLGTGTKGCALSIDLRELVGGPEYGWMARMPCVITKLTKDTVACDKRSFYTAEEVAEQEREWREVFARSTVIREAIIAKHGETRGIQDTMPCPCVDGSVCCDGTVRYSIAELNGHVHAACSTPNCCSFME